jgi:pilus assembly protein CpaF
MPTSDKETKNRIITIAGPKEGVGKTTIALNLALAWAGIQRRNVIIIPLDPLARHEHSYYLGINPPSVADLVREVGAGSITFAGGLLKGRIPMSQWGVGVLPLANTREELSKISPNILIPLLSKLSQSFDIFFDVESSFPMQTFAFDISDLILWVTHSSRGHLNATISLFKEYKDMHFPLDRFEVIANCYDIPGSIDTDEFVRFFEQLGKKVLVFMPWEDGVSMLSNQLKLEVVEDPQSRWVKGLRMILGRILSVEPIEKSWKATVSDKEFLQAAGSVWSSKAALSSADQGGESVLSKMHEEGDFHGRSGSPDYWQELKSKIHKDVVKALEMERVRISDDAALNKEVRKKVAGIAGSILQKQSDIKLSREQRAAFVSELLDEILGLGPIEELFRDPSVTEIMVNAPNRVFIERSGKLVLTKYHFRDDAHIIQVIKRIVAPLGRRIDESVPMVDARLKDGSRVNAIIMPLAVSGPTLTIRRFSEKPFGPEDYFRFGTITKPAMDFLKACVLLKKDIIISGGTGTGKTTFLNALSGYIPGDERIVTVEDTAELKLPHNHWVRLESRPPNIEGKGEITIRDLVKNCLRMRPDRIVVGEVRGVEALDMLQAMNTGHEGSLATIHANTPRDALSRLEAMCLLAGAELPLWALRDMISSAVHIIIQLSRFSDGSRKVTKISEITGRSDNQILTGDLFQYRQTGVDAKGKVQGVFESVGKKPTFYDDFAANGIKVSPELFWKNKQAGTNARNVK